MTGLKFHTQVEPIMYFQSSSFFVIDMIPCEPQKGVHTELAWLELLGCLSFKSMVWFMLYINLIPFGKQTNPKFWMSYHSWSKATLLNPNYTRKNNLQCMPNMFVYHFHRGWIYNLGWVSFWETQILAAFSFILNDHFFILLNRRLQKVFNLAALPLIFKNKKNIWHAR